MRRSSGISVLIGVISTLLLTASPAAAISHGTPDGRQHPNVGCIFGVRPDGTYTGCGTGQLISPTVVLTAAHVFPVLESLGATRFFVSFASTVDPEGVKPIEADDVVLAPSFNPVSFEGQDLAVLVLTHKVAGVTPVALPAAGLLDRMKDDGSLADQTFVVVGYGEDCTGAIPCPVSLDATRRTATESFIGLQRDKLTLLSNNAATDLGGVCFGDSGSPHFLGDSNVSVGVTHAVTGNCNTAVPATRLDTSSARAFLGRFVVLP